MNSPSNASATPTLVLASSSPYRRDLLARLGLPFISANPDVDEAGQPGEAAEAQVLRLAEAKARAMAGAHPGALVIGADQLAIAGELILSKPGGHEQAVRQLRAMRGREITFYTGVCLLNTATGATDTDCVRFGVLFRNYSDEEIERYLQRERPYQCAGSFMSEGLGISLVDRLLGEDPSALIGLPLIRLSGMLRAAGVAVP